MDKEIQESLWHYYYDVEKSVAYLVSKHVAKPRARKKEKVQGEKKVQGGFISFAPGGAVKPGCGEWERAEGGFPFVYFYDIIKEFYS